MTIEAAVAALGAWCTGAGVEDLRRTETGFITEVYVVDSRLLGRAAVLRRHDHEDRERLERRGLRVAADGGIPVAPRIPTVDGADVGGDGEGGCWSLYEWLPGRHVPRGALEPVHAAALGRMCGRIHQVLAGTVVPSEDRPSLNVVDTAETLQRIAEVRGAIDAHGVQGADEDAARRWLAAQERSLRAGEADEPPPALPPEQVQLVHGDYHDGNVLFDEVDGNSDGHDGSRVGIVGVLDWDRCRPWWPASEVVRCLALSFHLSAALSTAFVEAYRAVRPLPFDALDAAAAVHGYERAHDLWFFRDLYLRGNERLRASVNPATYVPFGESWSRLRPHLAGIADG